ncbi:MAG: ribonuclease P protein component [Candidatus Pacebacteria bacterium]|nr:ribonuclease P protein component [Candidatus Paceibacterota bacterium]
MLKKDFIINKQKDFERIFKQGKFFKFEFFVLKTLKTDNNHPRIGISVGTKVDKRAVYRNKRKRQIKAIFKNHQNSSKSLDLWVLVRKGFNEDSLQELEAFFKKNL